MKSDNREEGAETMMTKLEKLKKFAIVSIDELRDEEIRMTETTSFCLTEKASSLDLSVSERSPAIAGSTFFA